MPITPGAGQYVNIYAGLTGVLPITGNVTISGTVAVSQTNQQGMTVGAPVWVTGTVTVPGHNVQITGTITLPVSATNPITASVSNWPTTFPGNSNITASITLPVSATNPVTASVSNFPVGFNANITASITLPVSATNPVTASIANWPTDQVVHGLVQITASIPLYVTSSAANPVYISGNITSVAVENSVGATGTTAPASATLAGGVSGSVLLPLKVDSLGALYVTGTFATSGNSNVQITGSVPLQVTSTQANPVWVTGVMTVNTGTSGGGLVEITASIPLHVTSTLAAPIWVTGSTGGSSQINITQSITLPVSATNPVTASVSNFPTGFNANITASIPLNVTSTIAAPVWVTGTTAVVTFPTGFNSNITASITLPVSATNPITASISNWPTTFPGNVNITGSTVWLSASVVGQPTVTASVSNFPASVTATLSGSISASIVQTGFNSNITASITLPVSATNPVTASIANFPVTQSVWFSPTLALTASVKDIGTVAISATNPITASVSNWPTTFPGNVNITGSNVWLSASIVGQPTVTASIVQTGFNANITGSITLPVSATNPITASVANWPSSFPGNVNITGSNVWLSASVVGTVPVTSTVGAPIWVTGTLTVNTGTSGGGNVNVTASIPLFVTSTAGLPVWVTGTLTVNTGTGGGVTGYGTGSTVVSSNTGSLILGSDGTNLRAVKTDVGGVVFVSATVQNFPTGFNANITASVPLNVTSTVAAPVWVSGAVIASNLTPLINQFGSTHPQNGLSVIVGEGGIDGNGYTLSVIPTGASNVSVGTLLVTSTLTQPIWSTGTFTVGGTVAVSATNPITASVANFPTGFNANITGSITLPVSATNPITASIANWPTTFPGNVNITGSNVWLSASIVGQPTVTASVSNWPTTFPGNVNITGSTVWLSASVVGTVPVTATAGSPVWVTGTLTVNTGSSSGVSGYGTGSLVVNNNTGSLQLGSDGTNLRAIKTDAAGQVYIANPGGATSPTSGTSFSISATGTLAGVGLIAANASRKGLTIFNNASTNLYVSMGTNATTASFHVMMVPSAYFEAPFNFAGPVSGAWSGTPTGNAILGEQT